MLKALTIFLIFPFLLSAQKSDQNLDINVNKIAFGSCSVSSKVDAQLWKEVNQVETDLWIWLGDNIYGDSEDMNVLREKYQKQKSHPDYEKLLEQTAVIGIWDDHDYGVNDGGKEYPMKKESKKELFTFLDVAKNHPAWSREGAYQSYTCNSGSKKTKVILLDARYFRDPLKKDEKNWNVPDENGEILGAEQWSWFENQLQDKNADLIIIGSGIQVIPEEHRFEKWSNFPSERTKLFKLIEEYVNVPVLMISGDRHISEVSKVTLDDYSFPLYEFTSSSLTNPWGKRRDEANKYREKEIVYDPNFAMLELSWTNDKLNLELNYFTKNNKVLQTHYVTYD